MYVEDIFLTGDDGKSIKELKAYLGQVFYIKDLGELRDWLGIEVARSKRGIYISQRKYVLDLLRERGKLGAKPEVHHRLSTEEGERILERIRG